MLSQRSNFSVVTADKDLETIAVHSSYDGCVVSDGELPESTDLCWVQLLEPQNYKDEIMADYLDALGKHNNARCPPKEPLSIGWCSWYDYYEKISEEVRTDGGLKEGALKVEAFVAKFFVKVPAFATRGRAKRCNHHHHYSHQTGLACPPPRSLLTT
jgi:alpha-galactosidase